LVSAAGGEVQIGLAGFNLNRARDHQQILMEAVKRVWGEGNRLRLVKLSETGTGEVSPAAATPAAPRVNGDQPAEEAAPESAADTLKFMEKILRDADEIFGDSDDPPSTPPNPAG
jgi:hypothetical protein